MVGRYLTVLFFVAGAAFAAEKQYYSYPTTTVIRDNSRILLYDNLSGSRNITGSALKSIIGSTYHTQSAGSIEGLATIAVTGQYADIAGTPTIPDFTGKVDTERFVNYSTHVAQVYSSGAMLVSHNTAASSHDGHFVNTSNPHSVTASQVGAPALAAFTGYTAGAFKATRFTNFSTHWGKSDPSKLDVTTHNLYVSQTDSALINKLDTSVFTSYADTTASTIAAKTPLSTFTAYTSSRGAAVKGDKGESGYDGRDAPQVRCTIITSTSGVAGIQYDTNGLNPSVTTLGPFLAYLYEGTAELIPTGYEWYQPSLKTQLKEPVSEAYGAQIHRQYYEPRVQSTYSASRSNNFVAVTMRYSSAVIPFGPKYCATSLPIAVTKVGSQGNQGLQGVPGLSTRKAVFDLMSTGSSFSNTTWQFRPFNNLSSAWLMANRDYAGNVRWKMNGHGYQEFTDINGYAVRKVMVDGTIAILTNNIKRLDLKSDGGVMGYRSSGAAAFKAYSSGRIEVYDNGVLKYLIDPKNGVKWYRNGAPVFEVYSTGRWKGSEGYAPSVTKTRPYVTMQGFRGYTTATAGASGGMSNPYTLPAAGQTFQSPSGKARFRFYTSGSLVIY